MTGPAMFAHSEQDACQRTHTGVYVPVGKPGEVRRCGVHRLVRRIDAPRNSGLPAVYVTGCREALLVHESVRTGRAVTCRKPGCVTVVEGACSL